MSNFRLKDPDCVLIHIPKTGGSSIRHGIWSSNYDGPAFGEVPADWQDLFKFAFVRHPLERLISAFADFTQIWNYEGDLNAFLDVVTDESVAYGEQRNHIHEDIRHHAIPQTHPFNCLNCADFVGRYENYLADVRRILTRVGKRAETVPQIRKTEHREWPHYLSGATLQRAVDYYVQDFEQLGYAKP